MKNLIIFVMLIALIFTGLLISCENQNNEGETNSSYPNNEFEVPEPPPVVTPEESEISEIVYQIFSLEEAHEIISYRYPDAEAINYFDDDIINYTNPPAPVEVYVFEVYTSGDKIICAVSKEGGISFFYSDGAWSAFGGSRPEPAEE